MKEGLLATNQTEIGKKSSRCRTLYGELRKHLGEMFHTLSQDIPLLNIFKSIQGDV